MYAHASKRRIPLNFCTLFLQFGTNYICQYAGPCQLRSFLQFLLRFRLHKRKPLNVHKRKPLIPNSKLSESTVKLEFNGAHPIPTTSFHDPSVSVKDQGPYSTFASSWLCREPPHSQRKYPKIPVPNLCIAFTFPFLVVSAFVFYLYLPSQKNTKLQRRRFNSSAMALHFCLYFHLE